LLLVCFEPGVVSNLMTVLVLDLLLTVLQVLQSCLRIELLQLTDCLRSLQRLILVVPVL